MVPEPQTLQVCFGEWRWTRDHTLVTDHRVGPLGPLPTLSVLICLGERQQASWPEGRGGPGPGAQGSVGLVGIWCGVGWGVSGLPSSRGPAPRAPSIDSLHPLVVRVKGGFQMSPGSIGHPHPLQGVVPTLHEVHRDLRAGQGVSLVTSWWVLSHQEGDLQQRLKPPSPGFPSSRGEE